MKLESGEQTKSETFELRTAASSLYLFIVLFLGIGACVVSLDFIASYTLNAARAYVAGEGYYSKGQKDAVVHLYRYAASGEEAEYQAFLEGLAPALGDRQARQALQRSPPDLDAARQGFLAGRNHPDDIDKMIWMFLNLGDVSVMKESIEIWRQADEQVQVMLKQGSALKAHVESGAEQTAMTELLAQIETTDHTLSLLEDRFSDTLGEGARLITTATRLMTVVSTIVLVVVGVVLSRQIVQRIHRTEARLDESEARFRHVVESNIIGIAFWRNDGGIVDANQAFLDLVGYTAKDLPKLDWRELTAPKHSTFDEVAGEELARQGFSRPYEKDFLHKDGHRVPVILGSASNPGDSEGGLSFVLDVSEQRALEAALTRTRKFEAIGTLVGGIAHHFNNSLAAIYGNIEFAQGLNRDPQVAEHLASIQQLAERSAATIQKLMAFAHQDFLQFNSINLGKLVTELVPDPTDLLGPKGEFRLEIDSEALIVKGDEQQLKNTLLSLLSNASQAVIDCPQPKLTLKLHKLSQDSDSLLAMAELSITDNGVGMSAETQEHLFEPFFTTRPVGEGAGLSLAMVFGTINAHDGSIEFQSEEGKGTTVVIRLPLDS